jgi:hypothetical protein
MDGLQPIQLQLDASGVRELLQSCVHSMATLALQSTSIRDESRRVGHSTTTVSCQTTSPPKDQCAQTEIEPAYETISFAIKEEDDDKEEKENDQTHHYQSLPSPYQVIPTPIAYSKDQDSRQFGQTLQPQPEPPLWQKSPIKLIPSIQQYLSQPLRERRPSLHHLIPDQIFQQNLHPPPSLLPSLLQSLPPPSVWERQAAQRGQMVNPMARWAPPSFPSYQPVSKSHHFSIPVSLLPPRLRTLLQEEEEEDEVLAVSPLPASYGASNEHYSLIEDVSALI